MDGLEIEVGENHCWMPLRLPAVPVLVRWARPVSSRRVSQDEHLLQALNEVRQSPVALPAAGVWPKKKKKNPWFRFPQSRHPD